MVRRLYRRFVCIVLLMNTYVHSYVYMHIKHALGGKIDRLRGDMLIVLKHVKGFPSRKVIYFSSAWVRGIRNRFKLQQTEQ